jgi:hypothetical protein
MADGEFNTLRVWHKVSPGGTMIIPPQVVTIRITGLAEGGCRVEVIEPPEPGDGSLGIEVTGVSTVTMTDCTSEPAICPVCGRADGSHTGWVCAFCGHGDGDGNHLSDCPVRSLT